MRGSQVDINLSEMIKLEEPKKWYEKFMVSVSVRGEVTLNPQFKRKLQGEEQGRIGVNIYRSNDYKIIGIIEDKDSKFTFSENGRLKYAEWAQMLEKKGYAVPAKYIVEWNEKAQMWVGVLQEVTEAPQIQKRRKTNEKKKVVDL